MLRFNQRVSVGDVLSALKNAAQQSSFGDFKVDPDSIKSTDTGTTQGTAQPVLEPLDANTISIKLSLFWSRDGLCADYLLLEERGGVCPQASDNRNVWF